MTARLSAFFVWAALAASAVFWGLRLGGTSPAAPPHTVPVADVTAPRADLSRLFGAEEAPATEEAPAPEASSRFHLLGVVAPKAAGGPGVALIAVEDKPARAFRVGAVVDGDLVLQAVQARGIELGPRGGAPAMRLELPPLPPPATGSLPAPPLNGAAPPPAQPRPGAPLVPPTAVRPAPAMQPPQAVEQADQPPPSQQEGVAQ